MTMGSASIEMTAVHSTSCQGPSVSISQVKDGQHSRGVGPLHVPGQGLLIDMSNGWLHLPYKLVIRKTTVSILIHRAVIRLVAQMACRSMRCRNSMSDELAICGNDRHDPSPLGFVFAVATRNSGVITNLIDAFPRADSADDIRNAMQIFDLTLDSFKILPP